MIPFDGPVPAAGTYIYDLPGAPLRAKSVDMLCEFNITTLGGTSVDNFLQTSFDNGKTWYDVINLEILQVDRVSFGSAKSEIDEGVVVNPGDGTLGLDQKIDGFFGYNWRIKQVVVGAYNPDSRLRLTVNFFER